MAYNSFFNINISPELSLPAKKEGACTPKSSSMVPDRRNMSIAEVWTSKMQQPQYSSWTVQNAVKEGMKKSSWVYRCVKIISDAFSSVQYYVENKDGEKIENHPIEQLLKYPNPQNPSQDALQLISMWLELAGRAYWNKIKSNGRTTELWLISPDRLAPVPSKDPYEMILGYAMDNKQSVEFQPEEIIHFKFLDPALPIDGIAPLQACGGIVDLDISLQDFNTATAQQKGIVEGIFTVDKEYPLPDDVTAVEGALRRRIQGGKKQIVLGSNVKYQRISMTPEEMDFQETRRFNREQICNTFGVPLALVTNDASTYNNLTISELMLWTMTILPKIDDFLSTLNHSFMDELGEGNKLTADLMKIPAIRRANLEQVETAQKLYDMGVPFESINRIFQFGVDEFEGWEQSQPKNTMVQQPQEERQKKKLYTLVETRETADQKADKLYDYSDKNYKPKLAKLLDRQKKKTMSAIERGKKDRKTFESIAKNDRKLWDKELTDIYLETGVKFGEEIVLEKREIEDDLTAALEEYLEQEQWILEDISLIESDTVTLIIEKIKKSIEENWTIAELQQSIIDAGIFEDSRALRIARTTAGTSASIGELESAKQTGATHKTWLASNKETRKQHKNRNGETVRIEKRYSKQFPGKAPRYPLDHQADASDRINCRCSQSFSIRD